VFGFGALPRTLLTFLLAKVSEDTRIALEGILKLTDLFQSPEELWRSLGNREARDENTEEVSHRVYVAFRVRQLAYVGDTPEDAVWEIVLDPKWRSAVFAAGGPDIVEPVFESLCELLNQNPDKWSTRFPHLLADTFEHGCCKDEERRVVFGLLVLACVCTETTSALRRVLASSSDRAVREWSMYWHKQFIAATSIAPHWIRGRLRATMAVISQMVQ